MYSSVEKIKWQRLKKGARNKNFYNKRRCHKRVVFK